MKIIIKLSGKIIDDEDQFRNFLKDLKNIVKNNKIIVVHGGGVQVSNWMKKLSLEPKFIDGLRFTDKETLDVVVSVLCGLINKNIVKEFINCGIKKAIGLSCIDDRMIITDVDKKLGYVGKKILNTNIELLDFLLKKGYVVLISSVGLGCIENKKFVITNINADNVVYALASRLKPQKVIFITDKEGVLDGNNKLIKKLSLKDIPKLIDKKIVTEGMIPKLSSIEGLLKKGISEIVITNSLKKSGTIISN